MNCPRCNTVLNRDTVSEPKYILVIDTCPSCGGSWFDKNELDPLEKVIEPTIIEIRHIPHEEEQMQIMNCPSCLSAPTMLKLCHQRDKKVIMDYCPECKGIWLDKGELEAIQKENWGHTVARVFRFLTGNEKVLMEEK